MTTIVCQQVAPRIADLQANRRLSLSAIGDAAAAGADVIVLPERRPELYGAVARPVA
jgi:predicted amidohydrolase